MTRLAIPVLRPINGSGEVEPGSTLTFYDAGSSSVLKVVYSDSALSISLGSTVTADGEGLFVDIYYSGDIRMVWANSQGTIILVRDIYGAGNIDTGDIVNLAVTTAKIANNAVTLSKLFVLDNAHVLTSNGAANSQVPISGDATFSNAGVLTVTNKYWKSASVGGTADAITCVSSPVIGALADKMMVIIIPTSANATTTPTFAPDGLTAHTIVNMTGACNVGDMQISKPAILQYDLANTRWVLLNPAYGARSAVSLPAVQTPIAIDTLFTFAHSLPSTPINFSAYIKCISAELGWTTTTGAMLNPPNGSGSGAASYGFTITADATNVYVRVANSGIAIHNYTTGTLTSIDPAKWSLGIKAFS